MPLTDLAVRNLKPSAKPSRFFDERELYVEVSPSGGKWWRLKYRFGGKEKRLSLGVYPDVGLKDARERRDRSRKLIADGIDPAENRKALKSARISKGANSFEVVAREWLGKYSAIWSESHRIRAVRRFERDVFPRLGGRPITEVSPPELLDVLRRIEKSGAVDTAHCVLGSCGQIFRYAIATGRCDKGHIPRSPRRIGTSRRKPLCSSNKTRADRRNTAGHRRLPRHTPRLRCLASCATGIRSPR
jgi:hypothetical protein